MGTPEFAVPSLDAAAQRHQLLAVVTQPDRRSGRQKLQFSPVKERALVIPSPYLSTGESKHSRVS